MVHGDLGSERVWRELIATVAPVSANAWAMCAPIPPTTSGGPHNAVRHAHAHQVAIAVTEDAEALHVRVSDDGQGFDPRASTDGFGLTGMRERVALLHGGLTVTSSTEGTTIDVALPVELTAARLARTPGSH